MDAKIRGEKEQIRKTLVGVWLGGAFLDEAILVEKLKDLSPEAGEEVMRKAQYFATTMMAIDFKADGTLENEIEIVPPGGQPQSEQGFGTWKITQVGDDGFVVEIVEQHADGAVTKSRKVYQFYDDENHFAVSIPLEDVLGACNPLIVFERQKILPEGSQLAEAPRGSAPR